MDEDYFYNHLKNIKENAGVRYSPKLNVELPISEIFDGLGRTKAFYKKIRENFGETQKKFTSLSSSYSDNELQSNYDKLKQKTNFLFDLINNIKCYDTKTLPWENVVRKCEELNTLLRDFSSKLNNFKNKEHKLKKNLITHQSQENIDEILNHTLHYLSRFQSSLNSFIYDIKHTKFQISNSQFLLIKGEAGIGKTHLLCDVCENRIDNNLPTFLVFGEFFSETNNFWSQLLDQLKLKDRFSDKKKFLSYLNGIGKENKSRTILMIDALNENISHSPNFWKNHIDSLIDDIKKHPNIGLVISIRNGFENEVLAKNQTNKFICENHYGFQFREWEAVNKFFKEYKLPLPEIPLITPVFQKPLFLLLFCISFKSKKKVFRGHEGTTFIFEQFVLNATEKIAKNFNIDKGKAKSPASRIWNHIIKKIAKAMANKNNDRISEEKLKEIIKKSFPEINIRDFIKSLESNMLITNVPRYKNGDIKGFDYRFPFQKFSDHLIARYIFENYRKKFKKINIDTAKQFFSKESKFGKSLFNFSNMGIIESLSIQCPEQLKGKEFVEIAPYLLSNKNTYSSTIEVFIESLIWRNPKAFSENSENTSKIINENVISDENHLDQLLNALLTIAPVPNHPFNADKLHKILIKNPMPNRDVFWSSFLHYQYERQTSVDRFLSWSWSSQEHLIDESILLTAIALSWFLTTSNRFVRDKASKGLVCLLENKIHLIPKLLEKFKEVDDPYIQERLFAVAYGCVLRNQNDYDNLKILALWVYDNIFKDNQPPIHVLLRNYARSIIEVALNKGIHLSIIENNIKPPHKSNWPKNIQTKEVLKKKYRYYDDEEENRGLNSIWTSIMSIGNFGIYIINPQIDRLSKVKSIKNIIPNKIDSNIAKSWILNRVIELGYDVKMHSNFDTFVNRFQIDASGHKAERIGKKYQWIAFYEFMALVSDHFEFNINDIESDQERIEALSKRDIDVSFTQKNDDHIEEELLFTILKYGIYDDWQKENSYLDWIKTNTDLPIPTDLISLEDGNKNKWLLLEGHIEWNEETLPENELYDFPTRRLLYKFNSYIVRKGNSRKFYNWACKQNFYGRWMPESYGFSNPFLGEFANSNVFDIFGKNDNIWTDETLGNGSNSRLPSLVSLTNDAYINEFTYDCSHDEAVIMKLPSKMLIKKMKLIHKYLDGRFYDDQDNLLAIPTNVFNKNIPSLLLINKEAFIKFLNDNDYEIIWTLLGEKMIIGSGIDYLGHQEVSGVYTLDNKEKIKGSIRHELKLP